MVPHQKILPKPVCGVPNHTHRPSSSNQAFIECREKNKCQTVNITLHCKAQTISRRNKNRNTQLCLEVDFRAPLNVYIMLDK